MVLTAYIIVSGNLCDILGFIYSLVHNQYILYEPINYKNYKCFPVINAKLNFLKIMPTCNIL